METAGILETGCVYKQPEIQRQLDSQADRLLTVDSKPKKLFSFRACGIFPPQLIKLCLEDLQSVAGLRRCQAIHTWTTAHTNTHT